MTRRRRDFVRMKRQSPVEQPPPALTHPSGSVRIVRGRLRVHACRRRSYRPGRVFVESRRRPSPPARPRRSAACGSFVLGASLSVDAHPPRRRQAVCRSSWARRCRSTLTHPISAGGGCGYCVAYLRFKLYCPHHEDKKARVYNSQNRSG